MPAVQSRVSKASEFSFEGVFSTTHNIRAIFEALSSGSIAGFLRLSRPYSAVPHCAGTTSDTLPDGFYKQSRASVASEHL